MGAVIVMMKREDEGCIDSTLFPLMCVRMAMTGWSWTPAPDTCLTGN